MQFAELDDYCASLGMKVPGVPEFRHAMPQAPKGLFPPGESLWMSDSWQYNRNLHEMGSAVVWYGPGKWTQGPMSAAARLRVSCVDRLLATRASTRLHYVGIPKERMAQLAQTTTQKDPMWCWAAVAQMILSMRGQSVSQEQIVQIVQGGAGTEGISSIELARRLQAVGITATEERLVAKTGGPFLVSSDQRSWKPMAAHNPLGDSGEEDNVDSRQLARELSRGGVYILAYGTGASRAHAVLLFGLDIAVTPNDFAQLDDFQLARPSHRITIEKYHVMNPWPGKGHQVVSPDELQELVKWKVSMQRRNHAPF